MYRADAENRAAGRGDWEEAPRSRSFRAAGPTAAGRERDLAVGGQDVPLPEAPLPCRDADQARDSQLVEWVIEGVAIAVVGDRVLRGEPRLASRPAIQLKINSGVGCIRLDPADPAGRGVEWSNGGGMTSSRLVISGIMKPSYGEVDASLHFSSPTMSKPTDPPAG